MTHQYYDSHQQDLQGWRDSILNTALDYQLHVNYYMDLHVTASANDRKRSRGNVSITLVSFWDELQERLSALITQIEHTSDINDTFHWELHKVAQHIEAGYAWYLLYEREQRSPERSAVALCMDAERVIAELPISFQNDARHVLSFHYDDDSQTLTSEVA